MKIAVRRSKMMKIIGIKLAKFFSKKLVAMSTKGFSW